MRLKKITLNNFRCFEALEIELHPRLTVLVGTNGAGKTAVLDGIATALSPVLTSKMKISVSKHGGKNVARKAGEALTTSS